MMFEVLLMRNDNLLAACDSSSSELIPLKRGTLLNFPIFKDSYIDSVIIAPSWAVSSTGAQAWNTEFCNIQHRWSEY